MTLTAGGRAWHYVVRAVRAYAKAALPSTAVFGQRVTPRLVIITCGGPFDAATGHYLDNIVAWAAPPNRAPRRASRVVRLPRTGHGSGEALSPQVRVVSKTSPSGVHRLVGILHGCLKTGTLYDEATAWSHRVTVASAA